MREQNSSLLWGTVGFSGIGGYQEKMVSELLESGITVRKIKFSEGCVSGQVSPLDYPTVARTAVKNGVRIRSGKRRGLYFTLRKYKTRVGLYIGFLIFVFVISLWQTRVQDISVTGDVTRNQALQILSECGITEGAPIGNLNMSRAEHRLMLEVEDCAWADVSCEGFRVNVQVQKGVPKPEMESNIPCNIVASRPAKIVRQIVRNGSSVVGNGSGVNTGDMLVTGTMFDREKHILIVHADAEIIGEFTETREFYVPYTEQIKSAEGAKKTFKYLILGDDEYPLFWGKSRAENSLYTEETRIVTLFGNDTPMKIKTGIYTEYVEKTLTRSPENAVAELQRQRDNYADNFYADYEVVSVEESYFPDEDGVRLVVTYTLQGNIAVPVEIEADLDSEIQPEIPNENSESQPES